MSRKGGGSAVKVVVRLPSVLRADAGGEALLEVELPPEATLGDLLGVLATRYPRVERRIRDEQGELRRFVNVFVDAEESRHRGGQRLRLHDGAEVHVVPSVAGG